MIDQDGNFLLRGYNDAVAAKKARENDHKKNFGPKGKVLTTVFPSLIHELQFTEEKTAEVFFIV